MAEQPDDGAADFDERRRPDLQRQVPCVRGNDAPGANVEAIGPVRDADRHLDETREASRSLHHHVLHQRGGATRNSGSRHLSRFRISSWRRPVEEGVRDEPVRGGAALEGVRHSLSCRNFEAIPPRPARIGLHNGRLQQDVRGLHDHPVARPRGTKEHVPKPVFADPPKPEPSVHRVPNRAHGQSQSVRSTEQNVLAQPGHSLWAHNASLRRP